MMNKFSIGEVVIRRAIHNYPEANGEYTVEGIITSAEMKQLHPNMSTDTGNCYKLSNFNVPLKGVCKGEIAQHSSEEFLFKKHIPSQDSFSVIMNSLKNPVVEWN